MATPTSYIETNPGSSLFIAYENGRNKRNVGIGCLVVSGLGFIGTGIVIAAYFLPFVSKWTHLHQLHGTLLGRVTLIAAGGISLVVGILGGVMTGKGEVSRKIASERMQAEIDANP